MTPRSAIRPPLRTLASTLLATFFLAAGPAFAQTTASSDDLRGADAAANGSIETKITRLDARRAQVEGQRERHLARLAPDDPRRAEIDARYDAKAARLDTKQARLEARLARDDDDDVRREDRREDRRADRREDRRDEHAAARAGRPDRPDRPARPERPERPERSVHR